MNSSTKATQAKPFLMVDYEGLVLCQIEAHTSLEALTRFELIRHQLERCTEETQAQPVEAPAELSVRAVPKFFDGYFKTLSCYVH